MDKKYREIMLKMDSIIRQVYEIGDLAESTSLFPVRSYINFQENLEDFYQELRGAIKKVEDLNKASKMFRKLQLNSIYGLNLYADTDSVFSFKECFHKRVSDRVTGTYCKSCPYKDKCCSYKNDCKSCPFNDTCTAWRKSNSDGHQD